MTFYLFTLIKELINEFNFHMLTLMRLELHLKTIYLM